MNKTKIIATVSSLNYKKTMLEDLIISGVDVIRINMSYSTHEFCKIVSEDLEEINTRLKTCIGLMFDLEGPCIKTGEFNNGKAYFKTGDRIRVYMHKIIGNNIQFSVNYSNLIKDLKFHSIIKLSEGSVVLKVEEIGLDYAVLEVIKGGEVKSFSKVYSPGINLNRKFLTTRDYKDIVFANQLNIDYIGISNINDVEDVLEINDMLIELGNDHTLLLACIENERAVKSLDRIIDIADGIILSRSDLAIEMPFEVIPNIKNNIIKKCHKNGKICIISADFTSFIGNSIIPNRAEVSDLASSASQAIDAIMVTEETTLGKHPIIAIKEIEKVLRVAETSLDYEYYFNSALKYGKKDITGTVASSVALGAIELGAKAIIIATNSGYTAREMSRLKPPCIIIAAAPNKKVAQGLNLYFGVVPVIIKDGFTFDSISTKSAAIATKLLDLKPGDKIITTGGYPFKEVKHTNFMKIDEI